ncbi:MAG: hypothetical protein PHQ23_11785, partial [Candidatus Wallbacteria bacterium]|nr:hypothetical protein [Candidatus Wallbacteria bacterium]
LYSFLRRKEFSKALKVTEELTRSRPWDSELKFCRAVLLFHNGHPGEAVAILESLPEGNADASSMLGFHYYLNGKIRNSLRYYQMTVRNETDMLQRRNWERAVKQLRRR